MKNYVLNLCCLLSLLGGYRLSAQESKLWQEFKHAKTVGKAHQLPDFSYAGYKFSEQPIPNVNHRVFDVTKYGAQPNDGKSDKQAIKEALAAACKNGEGIIFFPKGRYVINSKGDDYETLKITSSKIVFRGEGSQENGSTLFFERDLPADNPNKMWSCPYAISTAVNAGDKKITTVVSDAPRETFCIKVADASNVKQGDWVILKLKNKSVDLFEYELSSKKVEPQWKSILKKGVVVNERHLVKKVNDNSITFYEPIHYDIQAKHDWSLHSFAHIERIGFEELAFEGNWTEPFIHHKSAKHDGGWSILELKRTVSSWVRNCRFKNSNRALTFSQSAVSTAINILIEGNRGHNAISIHASSHILVAKVNDTAGMWHASGVSGGSIGNVFWRCRHTANTSFEVHGSQPRCTLFDNTQGGFFRGRAGGAIRNLPNHGRHLVLWNYKETDSKDVDFEFWSTKSKYWRIIPPIIVGFHGAGTTFKQQDVEYEESNGKKIYPTSLFEKQLELRLGELPQWILKAKAK